MDSFEVWLPIAEMDFNIWLLLLLGFCVGVLGGFFGVGGGWIITPALNIFGFPMAFAIGTDHAQIFGKSIGATKKHHKMGNIDWKLGFISIIASVVGLELGSQIVIMLEKTGDIGNIVRWCYLVMMFGLGTYMLFDYRRMVQSKKQKYNPSPIDKKKVHRGPSLAQRLQKVNLPPMISFPASAIEAVSLWIVLAVFFFTGFMSGFLGVGGGFIRMPALVYLIGVPTIIAVGTDLMAVLFAGAYGCFTYAVKGRVEFIAAVIMLFGAAIGAQIGATAVKYIRGYGIRLLFAIMIILAGSSVGFQQIYKMTDIEVFESIAGFVLMGTATSMCLLIMFKLIVEARKEILDRRKQ